MTTQLYEDMQPSVDPDAQRQYAVQVAEERERELDHAVGRGALRPEDRDRWRDRLRREPDVVIDILRDLPGDPALAERNFEADPRLRSLDRQVGKWLEIPDDDRVIHYDADADTSASELAYRQLADALRPGR